MDLDPDSHIDVPLYWHHWRHGGDTLDALTAHLLDMSSAWLTPPAPTAASLT